MDILTNDELKSLTGYQQAAFMIRWLKSNKVPFLVARSGYPKVHKDALAHRMGAPIKRPAIINNDHKTVPNFDW